MIANFPSGSPENNVAFSVAILTWFPIVIGVAFALLDSASSAFAQTPITTASVEPEWSDFIPTPSSKLSVGEQQQLIRIKTKFVTPYNSKNNPGDRDTWYVIGFMDTAHSETRSRDATMLAGGTILWSDQNAKQNKVTKDAVIAHGRMAAAQAVLQYSNSPNAAAAKLRAPSNTAREGWMKSQNTAVAADRQWVYRAFAKESQARQFLENARKAK